MKDSKNKAVNKLNEEFDSDLQTWYQLQEQELPSQELDDAIIKLAKENCAENGPSVANQQDNTLETDKSADKVIRVENSFWRKNRWVLSSAASVMLVVTVIMLNPQSPQEILSDDAMPMMMQMNEPVSAAEGVSVQSDRVPSKATDSNQAASQEVNQVQMMPRAMSSSPAELERGVEPSLKQAGQSYQFDGSATKGVDAPSVELMPQHEAVVSAKQMLNHLARLIDTEQFAEAEKLIIKITKQYPQLNQVDHPEHQRWKELKAKTEQD
ncbi:hypothetical protein [Shewanella sp. UCD-KL12]|uniref:hypothetical protein n=1 Tax=Shewanella sp. UCD-KL12 TaxID=1917163 RepID=UPI0009702A39|nr:hypothetical protein [Shewanella sp. UCD-KL12]